RLRRSPPADAPPPRSRCDPDPSCPPSSRPPSSVSHPPKDPSPDALRAELITGRLLLSRAAHAARVGVVLSIRQLTPSRNQVPRRLHPCGMEVRQTPNLRRARGASTLIRESIRS